MKFEDSYLDNLDEEELEEGDQDTDTTSSYDDEEDTDSEY